MIKKILNIFYLILFTFFMLLLTNHYFSEQNSIFTNKSRSSYVLSLDNNKLPVLKKDTKNIIIYINEIEEFKKKRKKRIWEKLISN